MPEEFTTRDIFEQVDTRLTNLEQDLRTFRSKSREDSNGIRAEISSSSRWHVGMLLASWLTLMASIWLKQ